MPHQLARLLREVSSELSHLGDHAATQASKARATALSITLEAVKAGLPPGKLRDLAVELRSDATRAAEVIAQDQARIALRIGQALARATTLAREAEVLGPTRRRADLLAAALVQVRREVELGGEAAVSSAFVQAVQRVEERVDGIGLEGGRPVLRVVTDEAAWRVALDWQALAAVCLSGEVEDYVRLMAGGAGPLPRRVGGLGPRVWILAGEACLTSSHREEVPAVTVERGERASVVEQGRRRIAIVRVPDAVPGLGAWTVLATASPALEPARPQAQRAGEVILFPGMR